MKQTSKYILIFFTVVVSFFSWQSIERAINVSNSSIWMIPITLFSILFIVIGFDIVLIKKYWMFILTLAVSFFSMLFFSFNLWLILAILLALLISIEAKRRIESDLKNSIKIDLRRSLSMGSRYVVIIIGMLIATEHFALVQNSSIEKIIPHFNLQGITKVIAPQVISFMTNGNETGEKNEITVDQFIIQSQLDQNSKTASQTELERMTFDRLTEKSSPEEKQIAKDAIAKEAGLRAEAQNTILLEEGRKKFSEMTGKEILGKEKISDVFSDVINKKINDYFQPKINSNGTTKFLPFIISLTLFLTIISIGYFASFFLIQFMVLIFFILKKFGIVKLEKIQIEGEIIEQK